jgi:uncharacterized protein YdeI (BOF family)
MRRLFLACCAALVVAALLMGGCGGGSGYKQGSATAVSDTNATQVTVEQIAKNPQAYDSVIVTTEGNYAVGYCSACFLLKDGVYAVRVEVSDSAPLPPESKLNSRMQVTGKIYVAQESPNIVAENIIYK